MKLPIVRYERLDEYFGKQSCMLEHVPLLPKCLDWQWALETLDATTQTENKRVQAMPNGGFIVNSPEVDLQPSPFTFFENQLRTFMQSGQKITNQIYIALSVKSNLFSKHTDPGQNSFVWQCQGRTCRANRFNREIGLNPIPNVLISLSAMLTSRSQAEPIRASETTEPVTNSLYAEVTEETVLLNSLP